MIHCNIWCYRRLCWAKWLQNTVGEAVLRPLFGYDGRWWRGMAMWHTHHTKPTVDQHWGHRCRSGSCRCVLAAAAALRCFLAPSWQWSILKYMPWGAKASTKGPMPILNHQIKVSSLFQNFSCDTYTSCSTFFGEPQSLMPPVAVPLYPFGPQQGIRMFPSLWSLPISADIRKIYPGKLSQSMKMKLSDEEKT